ncbi:MAG: GNAT family N-acetyltransferase [Paracoccaceae bacterium]
MLGDGYHDVPDGKLAVAVTHLQMHKPAPLRGVPLPKGLQFETLWKDVAEYRDLFRRIGADWLWFGRLRLPEPELARIITDPKVQLYTLIKHDRPEALLELDFRKDGECELAYFGLTSALIGSGAGAYLMDRAIEIAWLEEITRFHVHTCTIDSPQALPFYIRSGFVPYKRQIEIADDPRCIGLFPADVAAHVPMIRLQNNAND